MSVSSSLSGQLQPGTIYLGDASGQQWSPDPNPTHQNPSRPAAALQWPGVQYENNNTVNGSGQIYGIQKTITTEAPNYFNQSNFSQSNREYVDLTHQKRGSISNNHFIPNGINNSIPNVTSTNANIPRNEAIYTSPYWPVPKTVPPPYQNTNNAWNSTTTNANHVSRTNWNIHKIINNKIRKPKRIRTAFTTQQMMELELEYSRTRYLDRNRRIELSNTLQLSEKTIKVWFQNRRMKDKKDRAEGIEDLEATSTTESSPEMIPPPPPYNNCHQTVRYNTVYNQGNIMPKERYQVPVPPLDTTAVPVPVHNAVINAYPNFFTPKNVTESSNINSQREHLQPQYHNIVFEEHNNVSSGVMNDIENNSEDIVSVDNIKEEELSPKFDNDSGALKENVSGENWELSWVRIMDMNGEV